MKKGSHILLSVCAVSLAIVIGIFIGRNQQEEFVPLPENDAAEILTVTEAALDYRLDMNSATKAQMMNLPGIGETLAQRIIDYRVANGPFQTIDDLLNVEGIGQKKLQQMEPLVRVGG